SLFDRALHRAEFAEHGGEPFMDREQPVRQWQIVRRLHRTAADEDEPVALGLDHAPACAAQAGVDADNPDGLANRWGCHGVVITPEPGERNINGASSPRKEADPARTMERPTHHSVVVPAKSRDPYAAAQLFWKASVISLLSKGQRGMGPCVRRDDQSAAANHPPIFAISTSEISKLA